MPIAKYFIEYQSDTDTEPTAACPWLTHGRYDRGGPCIATPTAVLVLL